MSVMHVVCPLVTLRGVLGEGFVHPTYSLSCGVSRGLPREGLSVIHVIYLLVTLRGDLSRISLGHQIAEEACLFHVGYPVHGPPY